MMQDFAIFTKGNISTSDDYTGTVWLYKISAPDSVLKAAKHAGAQLTGANDHLILRCSYLQRLCRPKV
jgi:hypothetical protein